MDKSRHKFKKMANYLVLSAILSVAHSSTYQFVSFVHDTKGSFFPETPLWEEDIFHQPNSIEEHHGHITPDFSNGLKYPDPLLLTGLAAKHAVAILYRKPLFFGDIDHEKAMYYVQEARRRSGLAGNKLGSLRPHLPFYRFKASFRSFN